MKKIKTSLFVSVSLTFLLAVLPPVAFALENQNQKQNQIQSQPTGGVHISYHWHMHQPIYWPAQLPGSNRVQFAAESYDIKRAGGGFYFGSNVPHPLNNLAEGDIGSYDPVFSNNDRIQAYQYGVKNSIATLLQYPDAGASISYSGSLMDNVWSWGKDNRLGYQSNWNQGNREAKNWKTSGGTSRADMVGFTYHHSLAPLLPKSVLRKEIQLMKQRSSEVWGAENQTKGFFPPEVAFSETIIPILLEEGFQWTIIANGHLARTCANYLDSDIAPGHSTSTWNTNPPNKADMTGPRVPATQWWSGSIDGRGAKIPAPFGYQAHWSRYVDPETGSESKIMVVPMDEVLSYMNGYSTMDTKIIERSIAPFNDPSHPSLVLFAHDGDNAWGGGFSYYQESVPGLASEASQKGYHMTSIQQFLNDHPVPSDDVVHVEDGAWVNPEGDWGDPQFVKWLYPPARSPKDPGYNQKDPRTFIDIENGFSDKWRSWAVITAGANYCETAEALAGANNPDVQSAWHYYLSGLDSGFMYYGDSLDDHVKQSLAANQGIPFAKKIIDGNSAKEKTGPTIFRPQRWPYNPGGMGWGVTTHYQDVGTNGKPPFGSDFYVWSLVYDVSKVKNVILKYRTSLNSISYPQKANMLYQGGADVSSWNSIPMNKKVIDPQFTGNPPNPKLNFFIQPLAIADHYWAKIENLHDVLVDYYIQATDELGNISKSDIFHVWVGPKS